ncbi:MAG TPA: hypothetical protein VFP68_25180, partial [Burkholderiaceae bacterium]|nr:hypothetical protein [Burkholderiaceae bacterium]
MRSFLVCRSPAVQFRVGPPVGRNCLRAALRQRLCHHLVALLLPVTAFACPPLSDDGARQLTLEAALARVDACYPGVRGAQAALAAAQADLITAGQRPNPQLTIGAGNLSHDMGSGSLWSRTFDHQLRIDQTI